MTKLKGVEIIEITDVADAEFKDMKSLERQVDIGYKRFLQRRGLPLPYGMKSEIDADFKSAIKDRDERDK